MVARAKDTLVAARKVAQEGAGEAAEAALAAALSVYEIAREMRTRTRGTLGAASEFADALGEQGNEPLERVQREMAARLDDGRAFARRVHAQASALAGALAERPK